MTSALSYASDAPSRGTINALPGVALLEFGTNWCGFCIASAPIIAKALFAHPAVKHLKVEDGRGRALGRSFGVKLWPTLIFLADVLPTAFEVGVLAGSLAPGDTVAVIGTGSSAVQSIPIIAEQAERVTVFQRTPTYAVPAHNRPLTETEIAEVKAHYRELRAANRLTMVGYGSLPRAAW